MIILPADCREAMPLLGPFDLIMADPPYGDTALSWDRPVAGWTQIAHACLKETGSMWVFGSMRFFLRFGIPAGFRCAQDIVWEKPNGTGFAKDRFKRVHEHAVQFYKIDAPWTQVYNDVQLVPGEVLPSKAVKKRHSAAHTGEITPKGYEYGDTRIQRSVIRAPSVRGGFHGTEKPSAILEALIKTSCPPGGAVGDFFAGSGSVGVVCAQLGRSYFGTEIDPKMAALAQARLTP